jgi:hypothetical protein
MSMDAKSFAAGVVDGGIGLFVLGYLMFDLVFNILSSRPSLCPALDGTLEM